MEELEILEGRLARALAAIRPMDQEGPAAASSSRTAASQAFRS